MTPLHSSFVFFFLNEIVALLFQFGVYSDKDKPTEAERQEHMQAVKKDRQFSVRPINEAQAIAAIEVLLSATKTTSTFPDCPPELTSVVYKYRSKSKTLQANLRSNYKTSFFEIVFAIWQWYLHIFADEKKLSAKEVLDRYTKCVAFSDSQPMRIVKPFEMEQHNSMYIPLRSSEWVFKGFVYEINGLYSDEEARLLILEDFDKERQKFERLKAKFDDIPASEATYERPRIPEKVRIEVWRRDGGKCARCGSREKLEYDHIVPISKGGSNTARNIELLCESCNRSKSNNIA